MSESEAVNILPKNNSYLLGQEKAEQILLEGWRNNSLHNSWLISGIEGIGKATLAYRFAKFLLAADAGKKEQYTSLEISENNPVFKLVVNNAHPDLKIIERDYTDTDCRKILKAIKEGEQLSDEEMKGLKKSAFIRVDDVRTINEFLTKRSADNNWRIVIIDSIDDMNPASANAVLKILEEPPYKTVMIRTSCCRRSVRAAPSCSCRRWRTIRLPVCCGGIARLWRKRPFKVWSALLRAVSAKLWHMPITMLWVSMTICPRSFMPKTSSVLPICWLFAMRR